MSNWLKITITSTDSLIEPLTDYLLGIIGAGTEILAEEDIRWKTLNAYLDRKNMSQLEIDAIISRLESHCGELADIFNAPLPRIRWGLIADQDWGQSWKKHFLPFPITQSLVIVPSWEQYEAKAGQQVIVIDPGMAFGTGHHPTTALVLQLIEEIVMVEDKIIDSVLDVGTGTGVLGMAVALFGVNKVEGIDNDPVAITVAAENIRINNLCEKMQVRGDDLARIGSEYDLVVANIIHDVLLTLAADLARVTVVGGKLILSGILQGEQERSIIATFLNHNFIHCATRNEEEWVALLFQKNT